MQTTLTESVSSLRERRLAAGISQQRLAELAGVSFHMVTLLDNGYAPARSRVRARVLAALEQLERQEPAEAA
jgi:predicted transcriptional regulator